MKKKFQNVGEALAAQREINTKLSNLSDLAQKRELNEQEKETVATLKREYDENKREIEMMNQEAISLRNQPEQRELTRSEQVRAICREARDGRVSREITWRPQSGNVGASVAESGAVETTIHDLIPMLEEGLALPPSLGIVTGVTGNDVYPVAVSGAVLQDMDETAETQIQDVKFDKLTSSPHRVSLAIRISNAALDNAAFDVWGYIQKCVKEAQREWLAKHIYSQAAFTTNKGPFSGLTSSGNITIGDTAYGSILKAVAQFTNKGFDQGMVCIVMDAVTEAELKVCPKVAAQGGFVIENGKCCGYNYMVSHFINTELNGGKLVSTADRFIGIGYFAYLAVQQHGGVRLTVDSTSEVVARRNVQSIVYNTEWSITDLSTKLNGNTNGKTQAFALYKVISA